MNNNSDSQKNSTNSIRKGIKDIWNAFMCEDADFSKKNDIPFCPTTATEIPTDIIPWDKAKAIYKSKIRSDKNFRYNAFVCFYLDDHKFDGKNGIWNNPQNALKIIRHFEGVITPDFSTNQDFPKPLKTYNTYRMRAFGFWLGKNGLKVINNVRWGTKETYSYMFDGLPKNSILCIGTVGGSPRKHIDRKRFEKGLFELVKRYSPHTIIVYGSANYPCFQKLAEQGIKIKSYTSHTALAFENLKAGDPHE